MSEYYMTHTGKELDDAINKVKSGYILPSETINIIENVSNKDITNGKILNVNVPAPEGSVSFTKYYTNSYTQTSQTLELSHTFNCGFKPKVVLIVLNTDTTLGTTYSVAYAVRINIDGLTSVGDGLYKMSTSNRIGQFGGGISAGSFTNTGFTYSHNTIGFAKSVTYDIYAWG